MIGAPGFAAAVFARDFVIVLAFAAALIVLAIAVGAGAFYGLQIILGAL